MPTAEDFAEAREELAKSNLLTGDEAAKLLRISKATFYRMLKYGPSQSRSGGVSIDVRDIPSRYHGCRRFWSRSVIEKLIADM